MMKISHFYKLFSSTHKEGILQMHVILYTSYKFYKKYNYNYALGYRRLIFYIQRLNIYNFYSNILCMKINNGYILETISFDV